MARIAAPLAGHPGFVNCRFRVPADPSAAIPGADPPPGPWAPLGPGSEGFARFVCVREEPPCVGISVPRMGAFSFYNERMIAAFCPHCRKARAPRPRWDTSLIWEARSWGSSGRSPPAEKKPSKSVHTLFRLRALDADFAFFGGPLVDDADIALLDAVRHDVEHRGIGDAVHADQ